MAIDDLTSEEREYLRGYRGSVADILNGSSGVVGAAQAAAEQAITQVSARYPLRPERLVALAAIARAAVAARDALLADVLAGRYQWTVNRHSGQLVSLAWQPAELAALGALAGLSPGTVRHRDRAVRRASHDAALAAQEAR